jgi:hypothetical protein
LARAKLKVLAGTVPSKRGAGKKRNEVAEEGALTEAVTFHGGQVQTNN